MVHWLRFCLHFHCRGHRFCLCLGNFRSHMPHSADKRKLKKIIKNKYISLKKNKKRIFLQCRRPRFEPLVQKIVWERECQPTPLFLPGESHGQRSLVGNSGHKQSDTTERLSHKNVKNTSIALCYYFYYSYFFFFFIRSMEIPC